MHDLFICFKGLVVIAFVWLIDFLMIGFISLSIMPSFIKDFFIESKEIINWIISVLVLYVTYLKLKKEKK